MVQSPIQGGDQVNLNSISAKSLKSFVARRIVGYLVATLVIVTAISGLYASKLVRDESHRHALILAKSAAKSFRPLILAKQERNAYFQIKTNLELKPEEKLWILDANGYEVYPKTGDNSDAGFDLSKCESALGPCVLERDGFSIVRVPIYFDASEQSLAAFLIFKLHADAKIAEIAQLIAIIALSFAAMSFGIVKLLQNVYRESISQLTVWTARLQNNLKSDEPLMPPFSEFESIATAIQSLRHQVEKLESAAETSARLQLLRAVSHDMRTPLSQLAKYVEIIALKQRSGQPIDASDIERVRAAMKRSSELIRQVKDMSADSEDGTSFTNVRQLLTDYSDRLKESDEIREKSIQLKTMINTPGEVSVPISNINIYRVVDNLVRNAVDFSPNGGEVQIRVDGDESTITIAINDQGPGIPEENQDRIFRPDFSTKPSRGTGLGLSTVASICERFGAKISFSNRQPRGSSFVLELPRASHWSQP